MGGTVFWVAVHEAEAVASAGDGSALVSEAYGGAVVGDDYDVSSGYTSA